MNRDYVWKAVIIGGLIVLGVSCIMGLSTMIHHTPTQPEVETVSARDYRYSLVRHDIFTDDTDIMDHNLTFTDCVRAMHDRDKRGDGYGWGCSLEESHQ